MPASHFIWGGTAVSVDWIRCTAVRAVYVPGFALQTAGNLVELVFAQHGDLFHISVFHDTVLLFQIIL